MRRLFWQEMVTLDGLVEGPNRELDWHVVGEDFARLVAEMEQTVDTLVFGRVTYQMMAEYWPTSTEPEARFMNELPKVVFSRTLKRVDWNNSRLASGDVAAEIGNLKRQPGKEIAMFGSADLATTFLRLGLIDEIRMFVNPLLLGSGTPMFKGVGRSAMTLLRTQTLSSGVVILSYKPA